MIQGTNPTVKQPMDGCHRENGNPTVEFCEGNELKAMNTFFQKTDEKLITYRAPGVHTREPWTRGRFETLDFVITADRWKNTVKNVEADHTANIHTDHFPLTTTINIIFFYS